MDSHQAKIFSAILLAATILAVVLVYFILTIVQNQRRYVKLQHARLSLEATTLENERRRIVSDLHDELGPLLSIVKFQISDMDGASDLMQKATDNLDIIMDRIRGICNELMPQVLLRKGLTSALREFIYEIDARTPLNLEFVHDEGITFVGTQEIHLYRIVQELVNNTIKHAHANNLTISIRKKGSKLIISIQDDGYGFDTEKIIAEGRGYGIRNILNRVNILKGELYITSAPGCGSLFIIEIPDCQ